MINYFAQPYPRESQTIRQKLLIAAGSGIFVGLFLIIFQPFGASIWRAPLKNFYLAGYGMVTFVVLLLVLSIGPFLFKKWYQEEKWTVGREISHTLLIIVFIAFGNLLYTQQFNISSIDLLSILFWVAITLAVGIIPASVITLINYNRLLHKHLTTDLRVKGYSAENSASKQLTLIAENEKDSLSIEANDLLFIESANNYSEVVFWQNDKREKKLLRSSLSRIEEQIQDADIVRCHRSFIVNLRQVENISGNAQGYKLQLKNEASVLPVARRYGDLVAGYFRK